MSNDEPYNEHKGVAYRHGFLLTHAEWHPSDACSDIGQPETGIWDSEGRFSLVQHGWKDFRLAEEVICLGLERGRSSWRIWEVMRLMSGIKEDLDRQSLQSSCDTV